MNIFSHKKKSHKNLNDSKRSEKNKDHKEMDLLIKEHTRVLASIQEYDCAFFNRTVIYFTGLLLAVSYLFSADVQIASMQNLYMAILLPFVLEFYGYSTIKYTMRTQELDGYAEGIEKRINKLLTDTPLLFEYSYLKAGKEHWLRTWGAKVQVIFICPIAIVALVEFIKALCNIDLHYGWKIFFCLFVILGAIVLIWMIYKLANIKKITLKQYEDWVENFNK